MRIPHSMTLFTATALLTAAASVGQPQSITTADQSSTTSGTPSTTTGTTSPTSPGTPSTTTDTTSPTSSGTPSTSTDTTSPTSPGTPGTTTDTTSPTASDASSSSTSGYGTTRPDTTDTTGTTSGAASGAYGTSGTTGTSGTAGTMDRDASSTAAGTRSSTAALQGADAEFVRKALEGGREEVRNAQLALQHAQRADTRKAASMMLEDHQRANEQLQQLAQRKGLSTSESTSSASAQGDEARSGSSMAGGGDFDSRYITEEIRHHRESIALFRKQASSGSDSDLRQFATDSLPKLEHHLEMLESANTSK